MRTYTGRMAWFVKGLTLVVALYHLLYIAGILDRLGIHLFLMSYRAGSLASILLLLFLLYPATKKSPQDRLTWPDILFMVLGVVPAIYIMVFADTLMEMQTRFTFWPALITFLPLFIAMLEATRRVTGMAFVIIIILSFLYPLLQSFVPGFLGGKSFGIAQFSSLLLTNLSAGIFGVAFGAASSIIVAFVVFSQFLLVSGAGKFFIDIALSFIGQVRGGPAKVAVIASGLFGTISGSPSANVAGTGSITIPMMKSLGYKPHFAGAVEAVASNGGQIVPPVMGLVIFVMSDVTGIPYWQICVASILPAILYYLGLYIQIDLEAAKMGLKGLPREQLPSFRQTMKEGWFYLLPLLGLLVFLIWFKYSPELSALYSTLLVIAVSFLRKEARLGPQKIATSLEGGIRAFILPGILCALVGVIIGSVVQTALGIKISSVLIEVSAGNVLLLLTLTAITCYILGLGVSSIPLYIMLVALGAPALLKMGIDILPAHLFVLWFGLTSFITPPEAVAVYVASSIARSNPWQTGWAAMRLGIATYLVPYMFVFRPELLLKGSPLEIVLAAVPAIIGISAVAVGAAGYLLKPLSWPERVMLFAGGALLCAPHFLTDMIGIILITPVVLTQVWRQWKPKPRIESA